VSEITAIDVATLTEMLARLEAAELLKREVDPNHARKNILFLTPQGIDELKRATALESEVKAEMLSAFAVGEEKLLNELLLKIVSKA
jgi:DNA-binding MarR family transcriptional regulator